MTAKMIKKSATLSALGALMNQAWVGLTSQLLHCQWQKQPRFLVQGRRPYVWPQCSGPAPEAGYFPENSGTGEK